MGPLFSILGASVGAGVLTLLGLERFFTFRNRHKDFNLLTFIERLRPGKFVLAATNRERLGQLFLSSGLEHPWSPDVFLALKRLGFFLFLTFSLFMLFIEHVSFFSFLWIGLPLLYGTLRWPEVFLRVRADERARMVDRELPHLIDALLLYIRAGLNLEGAFREFAKRLRGVWGHEWQRFVVQLDRGVTFRDAVDHLRGRFASQEFQRFLGILEQSRALGVPLADLLTIHADFLRAQRKQKAQELARTASVKISLPLVFFIFPALMIVFLGPAIIQLMETL